MAPDCSGQISSCYQSLILVIIQNNNTRQPFVSVNYSDVPLYIQCHGSGGVQKFKIYQTQFIAEYKQLLHFNSFIHTQ